MSSSQPSWLVWFLPFFVGVGMAFGALMGMSGLSDAVSEEGAAGDMAGAAGALMAMLCLVVGFAVTTLTLVVGLLVRRGRPDRIGLRVGLSVVGGGIVGALGSNPATVTTIAAWVLLVAVPVALAWPTRPLSAEP